MPLETPDEEVGATFCFDGGVVGQTNLAHTRDHVAEQISGYHAAKGEGLLSFNLSQESEETEGVIVLDPRKLLFVRLGKRHVVKRVQPVAGMLKK
jgi:hypothetical protein